MRKIGLVSLLWVFVIFSIDVAATDDTRVIVTFEDGIDYSLLSAVDYDVHQVLETIDALAITLPLNQIDILKQNPTLHIERDPIVQTTTQVYGHQHLLLNETGFNRIGLTGQGVKVAVLDTGIKTTHPDLYIKGGINVFDRALPYEDDNGHGTHVAGIIAAIDNDQGVVGISPGVDLYAIKALNEQGEGRQTDMIAGIEWAIQQEIDIINLSITTQYATSAFEAILTKAYDEGMLLVGATGNKEDTTVEEMDVLYPAKYETVIGVGSVREDLLLSDFSYTGSSVEFVAPGENVLSTSILEEEPYVVQTGTSMATPVVTAVFSLYKEAFPTLTADELRQMAREAVKDLGEEGHDPIYGYGLIQPPSSWFIDINQDDWYADAINHLRANEYVAGFSDYRYLPKQSVTRGEVAALLDRLLDIQATDTNAFTDVGEDYFAKGAINALSAAGIIAGYDDQTFKPQQPITRGEAATLFHRAFVLTGEQTVTYTDVLNEQAFYYTAVYNLGEAGVMNGYPDGTFKPQQSISRAEMATLLFQVLQLLP